MRNTIVLRANEGNDDDTGRSEGIAPRMTRSVLDHGVPWPELSGDTVIELEKATPGNDVLVVYCRGGMHARVIGIEGVAEPGQLVVQLADDGSHIRLVRRIHHARKCQGCVSPPEASAAPRAQVAPRAVRCCRS